MGKRGATDVGREFCKAVKLDSAFLSYFAPSWVLYCLIFIYLFFCCFWWRSQLIDLKRRKTYKMATGNFCSLFLSYRNYVYNLTIGDYQWDLGSSAQMLSFNSWKHCQQLNRVPLNVICMHEPDINFPEIGLQNNFKVLSPILFLQAAQYILPAELVLSFLSTVIDK